MLDRTFLARSIGAYGDPGQAMTAVARLAGGNPSRHTVERILTDRVMAIRADIKLRIDAVPVLALIHRFGFATAVLSDCGPELPELMPTLPLAPHLDVCVYSIETGRRKPDPAMYAETCDRLGIDPTACLYVGDGGSHELSGATAAGMTAVRLDAADLAGHLAFDVDHEWVGQRIESLTDVFDHLFATRSRSPVPVTGAASAIGSGAGRPTRPAAKLATRAAAPAAR